MIDVSNLHKKFKTFHALKGISLHVKKGEIYGFIGKNGAGKSTTMNILAGLSRPSAGQCIVDGKDVTKISHPSALNIGYLPEDPKFYPWMSAAETLSYLGSTHRHRASAARVSEMLQWVGLSESARRRVGGFSRGMRQRLGIAAALMHDPALVILDEPSSALDPEGRSDVLRLITDLKRMGKTVIFSTHILSDVQRVCDTVGIIAAGRMITEKPLSEIVKENIVPIYDVELTASIEETLAKKLKEVSGVKAVEAGGDTLAVTVTNADADAVRLMRFFGENQCAVRSFTLRKNNLEDIFIQEVNGK
jgi:ABC-2 type transport system ATP-binding protein